MEEFLTEYYTILTRFVEVLAAVTGLFLYKKYKFTPVKYFIFFLVYLTVCEYAGGYVLHVRPDKSLHFLIGTVFERNYWWYTSFWKIGAIVFFAFYYHKILKNQTFKTILKYSGFAFFTFSLIFIALNWNDFFTMFFPIIAIFGATIIFLSTGFYFIEILQSNRILIFHKSINFYISIAIFVWWLVTTPLIFYDLNFGDFDLSKSFFDLDFFSDLNYIFLKKQIYLFVNIFMYSTFTFALIFCKPELNND